jgi:osmotically-inducible protein OsmY
MRDDELRIDTEDELLWEPRVDDVGIEVLVDDGTVTLRGTVGSFRERRDAAKAVKRVFGVRQVRDELRVEPPPGYHRDDTELLGAVQHALMLDGLVPGSVAATVRDGMVTLRGRAVYQFERDEAEHVAGNVMGVIGVDNAIELLATSAGREDVKRWIKSALRRDARLDADYLAVESMNDTVILSGTVRSWAEHDAALNAAWAAPGVAVVDDRIFVVYSP